MFWKYCATQSKIIQNWIKEVAESVFVAKHVLGLFQKVEPPIALMPCQKAYKNKNKKKIKCKKKMEKAK